MTSISPNAIINALFPNALLTGGKSGGDTGLAQLLAGQAAGSTQPGAPQAASQTPLIARFSDLTATLPIDLKPELAQANASAPKGTTPLITADVAVDPTAQPTDAKASEPIKTEAETVGAKAPVQPDVQTPSDAPKPQPAPSVDLPVDTQSEATALPQPPAPAQMPTNAPSPSPTESPADPANAVPAERPAATATTPQAAVPTGQPSQSEPTGTNSAVPEGNVAANQAPVAPPEAGPITAPQTAAATATQAAPAPVDATPQPAQAIAAGVAAPQPARPAQTRAEADKPAAPRATTPTAANPTPATPSAGPENAAGSPARSQAAEVPQAATSGPKPAVRPAEALTQAPLPADFEAALARDTTVHPTKPVADSLVTPTSIVRSDGTAAPNPLTPQLHAAVSAAPANLVAARIVHAVKNGDSQFRIRLDPPELGRVDVRLDVASDGAVRAQVVADNRDALDLLQRDARVLERALGDAGLKLDSGSLNFSLKQQAEAGTGRTGTGESASDEGNEATAADSEAWDGEDAPRPKIAAEQLLDIRV